MFFYQQEMKKGSCQYTQNAKCSTLRGRVRPCIDVRQSNESQRCYGAENDSYADRDDDECIND